MKHYRHGWKESRRGFRGATAATVAALTVAALTAAACSGGQAPGGKASHPAAAHTGGTGTGADHPAGPAMVLQAMPAPYQLPEGISREAVQPMGSDLFITGGLTGRDATATDAVTRLNPVTGLTTAVGHLAAPGVVAAADGRRFRLPAPLRIPAPLAVPVRYAAAVAGPGGVWVFGGQTAPAPGASAGSRTTDVIQRVSPAGGKAVVAGRLPVALQGAAAISLDGRIYVAGGVTAAGKVSRVIYGFDPATSRVTPAGVLPVPVAYAAAAVTGGAGYLIGGEDGHRAVPAVTVLRLVAKGQAIPDPAAAPWLAPARGPGHLARGSDPSVLPGDVLIADHGNNRLLIIDPQGRIRWEFPRPGDLARGQTFLAPDDAFFSADGRYIVATQEDDQVISVISLASSRITYRFGVPGVPGAGPGHLSNPDDAMLTPRGAIIAADIKNCRIVLIKPPGHTVARVIGTTTQLCEHAPPHRFGSPNGAFPLTDGRYLVTEINGDWADEMALNGSVAWSAHPPGVAYPSDTNEVYPGRYLTADYSDPGQIVEFDRHGHLLWRRGGFNQPSLALPLPNGDILLNDDFDHRVCVVDPATGRIVWQYGHTGVSGSGPGYLNDPDGVDLAPPDSLVETHAATMGEP